MWEMLGDGRGKMGIVRVGIVLVFWAVLVCDLFADTVYLKNGNRIQGFVKKEGENTIELDVGCGTIQLRKDEIGQIYKSNPEETADIQKKWEEEKRESRTRDLIAQHQRDSSWQDWKANKTKAQEATREEGVKPREVEVNKEKGHIVVDALLNNKVKVKLLLDTGATFIVITDKTARALGINSAKIKEKIKLQVGDGREFEGKYTILKSVSVQGVEAKDVEAAITPETIKEVGPGEGTLGMSFLKNFSFKIDPRGNKLILEKLK
jgi:clan AA aspartic protease (TIGR02281 family)